MGRLTDEYCIVGVGETGLLREFRQDDARHRIMLC